MDRQAELTPPAEARSRLDTDFFDDKSGPTGGTSAPRAERGGPGRALLALLPLALLAGCATGLAT